MDGKTFKETCRVLLVDDHPLVVQGLEQLIGHEEGMEVVGTAANVEEGVRACEESSPDIALVDLSLGDSSGLRLIEEFRTGFPRVKVIVLSMHDELTYGERCFKAGAMGYIMKQDPPEKILEAILQVSTGARYMSEGLREKLLKRILDDRASGASPVDALSPREMEVYNLLARGEGTRQIAEIMKLSVKTIESYMENIKSKLGLSSSREVLIHAIRWHLLNEHSQGY